MGVSFSSASDSGSARKASLPLISTSPAASRAAAKSAGEDRSGTIAGLRGRGGNEAALGRPLALLGDSSGIPLLIRNLDPRRSERWSAEQAGKTLNALTGQAIWTASADPGETRAAYQEWWDANKERLVWVPLMRCYRVGG